MGASTRRDLYLSVNGNVDNLATAMKAGKSMLAQFGGAAEDAVAEIEKAFDRLDGGSIAASAKALEANYTRAFTNIKANMQQVAAAPTPGAAFQILNLAGAEEAVAKAERQAAALQVMADAATRAAAAQGGESAEANAFAAAAHAAAIGADRQTMALRTQLGVLTGVKTELVAAGVAEEGAGQATGRHGSALGSTRIAQMEFMHVVTATNDAYAAGIPLTRIMGMEMGRMVEAISFASSGESKFAAFMQGPWGIALMIGVNLLAALALNHENAGKAADKQKDAENDLDEVMKRLVDETKNLNDNELVTIQRHIDASRAAMARAQAERELTKALLEQAIATERRAEDAAVGSSEGAAALGVMNADDTEANRRIDAAVKAGTISQGDADKFRAITGSVTQLQQQLDQVNKDLEKGGEGLRESLLNLGRKLGEARATPAGARNFQFSQDQIRLNQRARDEHWTVEQTAEATKKLTQARDADLKKIREEERERKKRPPSLGNQVASQQGKDLLASAEHYKGLNERRDNNALRDLFSQAHINIDPKMTAWCAAFVNAVLATNGLPGTGSLSARSFLNYGTATNKPEEGDLVVVRRGNGGQGHVGFFQGTDSKGNIRVFGGNTADSVGTETVRKSDVLGFRRVPTASEAQRQAESAAGVDKSFQAQVSAANQEIARAQAAVADTIEQRLAVELEEVNAKKAQRDAEIDDMVKSRKIPGQSDAEIAANAQILHNLNARVAAGETDLARKKAADAILDRQLGIEREDIDGRIALLQLQEGLVTTTAARKRIADQILDLEEKIARDTLQEQIAKEDDPAKRAALQQQLDRVGPEFAAKHAENAKQNGGPLSSYSDQLHRDTDDMNAALQSVEVDGLKGLEDGLLGIIDGTESVSDAFKKMAMSIISDLARIAIEKAIVAAIASFAGGAVDVPGHATGLIPGYADGIITGPGTGTSDSIPAVLGNKLIRVSNGESIITAAGTRRYRQQLKDINSGRTPSFATGLVPSDQIYLRSLPSPQSVARPMAAAPTIIFDARHAVMTEDLLRQMNAMAAQYSTVSIVAGSQMAQQEIGDQLANRIPT